MLHIGKGRADLMGVKLSVFHGGKSQIASTPTHCYNEDYPERR